MGSVTDGFMQPWGTYLTMPGMPGPAGPISGSPTDGMRIAPAAFYQAPDTRPLHGWWDTPAVTAPAPAPAPDVIAPPPDVVAPPPVDTTPPPAAGFNPGGPITQPTSAGNTLASAVLDPPVYSTKAPVYGAKSTVPKTGPRTSMTTTQT